MGGELVDGDQEAVVVLDRDAEEVSVLLDGGGAVAGVQDERLDVVGQVDPTVDVGLEVVVERVLGADGVGQLGEGARGGSGDVDRLEDAVGVAERRAGQRTGGQSQVGGPEAGRAAGGSVPVVEGAVDGTGRRWGVVVGAAEEAALPPPAVTAGVGAQATVARAGLELGAVAVLLDHEVQDGRATRGAVGVEVHRRAPGRVDRTATGLRGDVPDGPGGPLVHRHIVAG